MTSMEFQIPLMNQDVNDKKVNMPCRQTRFPQDVYTVVTFTAVGDNKMELTVTEHGYLSDPWYDLSKAGLEQCLDKMAASLARV